MKLIQTFENPINGWWDGGPRKVFEWTIDHIQRVSDGKIAVGSFDANHWFAVKKSKTEKQILFNAQKVLANRAKKLGLKCEFHLEG